MHDVRRRLVGGAMALAVVLAAPLLDVSADGAEAPALGGSISGQVTGPGGGGVAGVEVYLFAYDTLDGQWHDRGETSTAADGSYNLTGLVDGTYRVGFYDPNRRYDTEFFDNVYELEDADDVVVTGGGAVYEVDANLANRARISGRVTNEQSLPLYNIRVRLYALYDGAWDYSGHWTYTDPDGDYEFVGTGPGTWRIEFYDRYGHGYTDEFWNDKPTVEVADDVVVTPGTHVSGRNAALARAASISGTVTTESTTDTQWFDLELYRKLPEGGFEHAGNALSYDNESTPAYDGFYEFTNVQPGTYRIKTYGDELLTGEYWNDKPSLTTADDIVVGVGAAVTGKNVHLTAAGPQPLPLPLPAVVNTQTPQVSGRGHVGDVLRSASGTWQPTSTTLAYQWLADGVAIPGATGTSYSPQIADVGKAIALRVTGSAPGHQPVAVVTAAMGPVPVPRLENLRAPRIVGEPRVGALLVAKGDRWDPAPAVRTYQWRTAKGGIKGATGRRFRVTSDQLGTYLAVTVKATVPGMRPRSVQSKWFGKIKPRSTRWMGTPL